MTIPVAYIPRRGRKYATLGQSGPIEGLVRIFSGAGSNPVLGTSEARSVMHLARFPIDALSDEKVVVPPGGVTVGSLLQLLVRQHREDGYEFARLRPRWGLRRGYEPEPQRRADATGPGEL